MVTPLPLFAFAVAMLLLAGVAAWLGGRRPRDAVADAGAAVVGTSLVLLASAVLFAVSPPLAVSQLWRDAGSVALLASPLGATLALRCRARRSIPRALLASALALAGVVLWLTLNLRGPRGGWTTIDLVLVLPAAAIVVASAACLGWWSKQATVRRADSTPGG